MKLIPKKSLGQNFLRAPAIARVIAETACPLGNETVLEIGPGEGALTDELLKCAKKVVAVEKDARLIEILQKKYAQEIRNKKLALSLSDILSHSPEKFIRAKEYVVAANIPYYITGAIIKHLLSAKNKPKRVVFLVQKEVAWRIAARKGRPFNSARGKESVLSISVKVYGTPRIVRVVPAGAFYPRPKVDSAIIVIENIQNPFRKKTGEEKFFKILKCGFAHKRKLLRRNLGVTGETLALCGIQKDTRPETLSEKQWLCLSKKIG